MASILTYFRKRADRKLRERCVNYVTRGSTDTHHIALHADELYNYIKNNRYPYMNNKQEIGYIENGVFIKGYIQERAN